ncbi:type II toxin-antitoxin system RelE/ParE family toxin [uncultured Maricaulis sp.]|uniref:type II toxin-antitoxin system RelE/ParE family toxin n=1 Tax=uncultured Maricaulis sp. TaxID=174710 RepID=UPI0030D9EF4D
MGYKISRAGEDDLIALYLDGAARFGTLQADAYHDSLAQTFQFLGDHPEAARERSEITPPVRCHPHAAHLVIYLIDSDGDAYILRIRHAREDWERNPG